MRDASSGEIRRDFAEGRALNACAARSAGYVADASLTAQTVSAGRSRQAERCRAQVWR